MSGYYAYRIFGLLCEIRFGKHGKQELCPQAVTGSMIHAAWADLTLCSKYYVDSLFNVLQDLCKRDFVGLLCSRYYNPVYIDPKSTSPDAVHVLTAHMTMHVLCPCI